MIIDKDRPMEYLRWYKEDGVKEVKKDYAYLCENDVEYFFDAEKKTKDRLWEIRKIGSNNQYHLVCVSKGLVAVHFVDFMNWNDIPFDAEKYLN